MSLKAYEGLMTRKGLKYVQDETIKRIPKFRAAGENQLLEKYAEMVLEFVDYGIPAYKILEFAGLSLDRFTQKEYNEIKITADTSLISLIYQISRAASKSMFMNPFTVELNLSLEAKERRTLVYPSISVPEYRGILREYLIDWYAQDQCDPPDDVSKSEWKTRCKDWWNFGEIKGFQFRIRLFNPDNYDSINNELRGDALYDGIIAKIPINSKRQERIAIKNILKAEFENSEKKKEFDSSEVWKYIERKRYYRNDTAGQLTVIQYVVDNNIVVQPITKEILESKVLL
ncbi:MAG: hypothetical protein WC428_02435 [Candidatus Paceibacterota bacterium]